MHKKKAKPLPPSVVPGVPPGQPPSRPVAAAAAAALPIMEMVDERPLESLENQAVDLQYRLASLARINAAGGQDRVQTMLLLGQRVRDASMASLQPGGNIFTDQLQGLSSVTAPATLLALLGRRAVQDLPSPILVGGFPSIVLNDRGVACAARDLRANARVFTQQLADSPFRSYSTAVSALQKAFSQATASIPHDLGPGQSLTPLQMLTAVQIRGHEHVLYAFAALELLMLTHPRYDEAHLPSIVAAELCNHVRIQMEQVLYFCTMASFLASSVPVFICQLCVVSSRQANLFTLFHGNSVSFHTTRAMAAGEEFIQFSSLRHWAAGHLVTVLQAALAKGLPVTDPEILRDYPLTMIRIAKMIGRLFKDAESLLEEDADPADPLNRALSLEAQVDALLTFRGLIADQLLAGHELEEAVFLACKPVDKKNQ